ncbi:MAG: LysR substrate-binding domain-containing protein [Reyranellaceae bacterium]
MPGPLSRHDLANLPAAVLPLSASSRSAFPADVKSTLRIESMASLKQMAAVGLGYGLLPFSGIHKEIADGTLAAARLPWLRGERVLALPRGRPVTRATRETVSVLEVICKKLIADGKILVAPSRRQR